MLLHFAYFCRTLSESMAHRNQPDSSPSSARARLAALGEKKQRSKAAHLRSLWPEIKAALDSGHTLKAVCECLEGDGLKMSIYTLGSYVARMRRGQALAANVPAPRRALSSVDIASRGARGTDDHANPGVGDRNRLDPLTNLRKSQSERPAFDYRPELADPDKLI